MRTFTLGTSHDLDCKEEIMADNNDVSTGKGKRKLRGPYNQYLSQPEVNLPRSTLQKWPKTTSVDNILSVKSSSESITDPPTSTCVSSSNSLPNNCMTSVRERIGELHDQTSSCTATVSHEWVLYEGMEEYYEANCTEDCSDEPELEREIEDCEHEETFNSSETGEFINETENVFDDEEDYLDALCGDENPLDSKQVNEDDDRDIFASGPLYNGPPINVGVSMLLIITFAIRHSLTGVAVVDLLTLVSLHCALPNQCASSMELLKKFFMKLKNPIQFHYYCTFCLEYQGLCIDKSSLCKNKGCLKCHYDVNFYFYFPPFRVPIHSMST